MKRRIAAAFELPKDVVLDLPLIYMIGDEELVVSNHKGIVGYIREMVRIKTAIGVVAVLGRDLVLREISKENIVIIGKIGGVEIRDGRQEV